MVQSHDELIL
jgi:hypothetical protein